MTRQFGPENADKAVGLRRQRELDSEGARRLHAGLVHDLDRAVLRDEPDLARAGGV